MDQKTFDWLSSLPGIARLNLPNSSDVHLKTLMKVTQKGMADKHLELHLDHYVAIFHGVAQYDIEICALRSFNLDCFVDATYSRLESSHATASRISDFSNPYFNGTAHPFYPMVLVKNLKYVEFLGLSRVDWHLVGTFVSDARQIMLDLPADSKKDTFPYFDLGSYQKSMHERPKPA
jgi:hypothetical protein